MIAPDATFADKLRLCVEALSLRSNVGLRLSVNCGVKKSPYGTPLRLGAVVQKPRNPLPRRVDKCADGTP